MFRPSPRDLTQILSWSISSAAVKRENRPDGTIRVSVSRAVKRIGAKDKSRIGTARYSLGYFQFLRDYFSNEARPREGRDHGVIGEDIQYLLCVATGISRTRKSQFSDQPGAHDLVRHDLSRERELSHEMTKLWAQLWILRFVAQQIPG
jgi:hypothetical protein